MAGGLTMSSNSNGGFDLSSFIQAATPQRRGVNTLGAAPASSNLNINLDSVPKSTKVAKKKETAKTSGTKSSTSSTNNNTTVTGAGTSNTNKTDVANVNTSQQNMTAQALAALNNLITNSDPVLSAIDQARANNVAQQQAFVGSFDPNAAAERAGGQVADLTRNLIEQVLPGIFGGAENAGFGGDALSQLLSQDAAVRTGEAQARVQEKAFNDSVQQKNQAFNNVTQAANAGSAVIDTLLSALDTAKGAVANTTGVNTTVSNAQTNTSQAQNTQGSQVANSNEVANQVANTNGNDNTVSTSPIDWAKLISSLSAAGNASQLPSQAELALAAFNASKTPNENLKFLFGGNTGTGIHAAQASQSQQLWNNINKILSGA